MSIPILSSVNKLTLSGSDIPEALRQIAGSPSVLYTAGTPFYVLWRLPRVAIVGSRKVSNYGQEVTHQLAFELARRGVVIISGLAFGVDAVAHRAALEAGGITVAVLPSAVEEVYPASHRQLA